MRRNHDEARSTCNRQNIQISFGVAGGMGARPGRNGVSGVHTHMTNSLNTPAEALEYAYPLRVCQYSLRKESGGKGEHSGGDGIVREIEVLTDCEVTLLADRRERGPWGLAGGSDGARGTADIVRRDGSGTEPLRQHRRRSDVRGFRACRKPLVEIESDAVRSRRSIG